MLFLTVIPIYFVTFYRLNYFYHRALLGGYCSQYLFIIKNLGNTKRCESCVGIFKCQHDSSKRNVIICVHVCYKRQCMPCMVYKSFFMESMVFAIKTLFCLCSVLMFLFNILSSSWKGVCDKNKTYGLIIKNRFFKHLIN